MFILTLLSFYLSRNLSALVTVVTRFLFQRNVSGAVNPSFMENLKPLPHFYEYGDGGERGGLVRKLQTRRKKDRYIFIKLKIKIDEKLHRYKSIKIKSTKLLK